MNLMMRILIVGLTLFLGCVGVWADSTSTFGVFGGINVNSHTADLAKLQGIPNCCPIFQTGSGVGFNAGALFEQPVGSNLQLGIRVGVMTLDGELSKEEPTSINIPSGPSTGTFQHVLQGSFTNLGIEPTLMYSPFPNFSVNGGGRIGYNVSTTFYQVETLNGPGTFVDEAGNDTRMRTRNEFSGDIPNANPWQIWGVIGVSYELPLNTTGNLRIAPEASYYLPFTELVNGTQWKASVLRFGLAIKYSVPPKPGIENVRREKRVADTVIVERSALAEGTVLKGADRFAEEIAEEPGRRIVTYVYSRTDTLIQSRAYALTSEISAVGVDSNGREVPNPVIRVTEYVSNRLDPLLNHVFFDENSSIIPDRYRLLSAKQTPSFEIDDLFRDSTLDIYYSVLNIVGRRMLMYPRSTLRIIGCNAGTGNETGNTELSNARAMRVHDYLRDAWGIGAGRLKVEARNLPTKLSSPIENPEKAQENRRVELESNDDRVTESVYIKNIDRSTNLPVVRFHLRYAAEAGLASWDLRATQLNQAFQSYTLSGNSSVPNRVDWKLDEDQKTIPQSTARVLSTFEVRDAKGQIATAIDSSLRIEVISLSDQRRKQTEGFEVEKFSLILFDFDKANLEGGNLKIIDIVKKSLRPNAEVIIVAYTDRTGLASHNVDLSQRRAEATKNALGMTAASATGVGAEILLFDNDLPEGRFYCRTVTITVRVKK